MDETDQDETNYKTPFLTPHTSEKNKPKEDLSSQYSASQTTFQNIETLNRALERHASLAYASDSNNYETESESDAQDQQPTEATDDSNDPNQQPKNSVETTLDTSLHVQLPEENFFEVPSSVNETESSEESLGAIMSDITCNYASKTAHPSSDVCGASLCVPYTTKPNEKDEIVYMKTISTTLTTEDYNEPKKKKNNIGHIMISYNHSTKLLCSKIARELKSLNYLVWIDQDNISGDILTSMASAVENAYVVLMAINEQYFKSRYCRLEAEYCVERNKEYIPMLMQADYKPAGWLGLINGARLHVDFSTLSFDEAFILLRREIDAVRVSLGVEGHDHIGIDHDYHFMTTTSYPSNDIPNVLEWSADDVVEWLNREKLEIFVTPLTNFTGATLWQLYKIKFDAAAEYYRTVETLLPATIPLRLFYNLTFNAAIESLFSSSNQGIQRH